MYGKTLFFVVIVVLGAVLPYLLADETWLAKFEALFEKPAASTASLAAGTTKPTTSGKPVPRDRTVALRQPGNDVPEAGTPPFGQDDLDPTNALQLANRLNSSTDGQRSLIDSGRQVDLPRFTGPPGVPLEHLLSFQATPEWIGKNWSRVTTRLADLDLHGWRVPIMLENQGELYGSITYYFDQQRQVQRILLHGYTSDASDIVQLATTRYQMKRIPSTVSELFTAKIEGRMIGGLRVDFTPILKSNAPKRCEVFMELNRQGSSYGMSHEFTHVLRRTYEENQVLSSRSSD